MRIIADQPALDLLCKATGGSACSAGEALSPEEPLLVFAHAVGADSPRRSEHAGLATFERIVANSSEHSCRAIVLGFLPAGKYGNYQYLLDDGLYRQLPISARALARLDFRAVKDSIKHSAFHRRVLAATSPRTPIHAQRWDLELTLDILGHLLMPSGVQRADQVLRGTQVSPLALHDPHAELNFYRYLRATGLLSSCEEQYQLVIQRFSAVEVVARSPATRSAYDSAVAALRDALFALCAHVTLVHDSGRSFRLGIRSS